MYHTTTATGSFTTDYGDLRPRPPNLLILGASGQVAQAVLRRLPGFRDQFGKLVLLDHNDFVVSNRFLDHARLDYRFIRRVLRLPEDEAAYLQLLREQQIDVVLDLTDLSTLPVLRATDAAGASYVNTALNDPKAGVTDVLGQVLPVTLAPCRAPHIVSSGMNPGAVNIWVWHGSIHYGPPQDIVHFEYDTSMPETGWQPLVTWSRQEFLAEIVREPAGCVVDGEPRLLEGPAIQHREEMRSILEPVMPLRSYPRGFLVLHEENLQLGRKLGASSKYLYAIHPNTMDHLYALWRERGVVDIEDLALGDNTSVPLVGADTIGVCLDYPGARVYYLHRLANKNVHGTNATCAQVAVGVEAALRTLLAEDLAPRLHFATDLYHTVYADIIFQQLPVAHFVFEKQAKALMLTRHVPRMLRRLPSEAAPWTARTEARGRSAVTTRFPVGTNRIAAGPKHAVYNGQTSPEKRRLAKTPAWVREKELAR